MAENRDVFARTARRPDLTVRYGEEPDQVADVYLPATGPAPLVLCWHGGYWRQDHDRGYVAPLAADLADRGYAVASVEYRRTGGAARWPDTLEDAASLADTVPGLVVAHAPAVVAAGPAYHVGHSTGGHLALWTALRHRLPPGAPGRRAEPAPVRGVLALAPVTDVAETYRRDLDLGAVRTLLGGGPRQYPDRYAATDPAPLPAPDVPTVLVHGRGDARVPVVLSREYARRHRLRLVEIDGADHFAVVDPASPAWPTVVAELAALR